MQIACNPIGAKMRQTSQCREFEPALPCRPRKTHSLGELIRPLSDDAAQEQGQRPQSRRGIPTELELRRKFALESCAVSIEQSATRTPRFCLSYEARRTQSGCNHMHGVCSHFYSVWLHQR